jgi:hypothetical protein
MRFFGRLSQAPLAGALKGLPLNWNLRISIAI